MIHIRPGSQAGSLTDILSIVGEYPYSSLYLLGSEKHYRRTVKKLITKNELYNSESGERVVCKLLNLSGKGSSKSIRLYKDAIPILRWISPYAIDSYMSVSKSHKFSGDEKHIERNHRIAEALAMCMRTGMEYRTYMLPKLQNKSLLSVIPNEPVFYPSRYLKNVGHNELNKTMFTRLVGAVFSNHKCFAVYNTRNSVMKWNGMGEFKALHSLIEVARMNAGISSIDSAILLGRSDKVLLDTLRTNDQNKRLEFRFDSIYRHIHFIPLDDNGIRLFKIICLPEVQQLLLDLLFESDTITNGLGLFEYDAYINQKYILSHLDGDIARLIRFKEALLINQYDSEVICFDFQANYINKYLAGLATVKTIELSLVETELGII